MYRSIIWAGCLLVSLLASETRGQDLIQMYRRAEFQAQAQRILKSQGLRAAARPYVRMEPRNDALRAGLERLHPRDSVAIDPPEPAFTVSRWRAVRRLERGWFENRFQQTKWAYLGNDERTLLDTTYTRVLRGRLEAHFGAPTRTIVEASGAGSQARHDYVQFEYWLVVNDSIPVILMDPDGPFDRGLVVASDHRYRNRLVQIRRAVAEEIGRTKRAARYVDYYYQPDNEIWYRTGYDGIRYFTTRIQKPNLKMGRPRFDTSP